MAYSVDRDQGLDVYVPAAQSAWTSSVIFVRTAAGSTDVARQLAAVVGAIDRRIALTDVGGMEALLARSISVERYVRTALLGFGVAALLVAMLGTWTLVAQAATRSRRELAIRAALGASSRHLAVLVARGGIIIAIAGAAAGATATWWWGSVLATLLRGMSPRDPLSLASGPLIIAVSIVAAIAWPSLRAARVMGSEALRSE